jgi:general bacterial porin, GBP family
MKKVVDYLAPLSFTGHHPGGNNLTAHPYDNDNLNNAFRVNNSVKFASNDYAGLRFGSLYGFSNEAGGFADNRLYSFGASYNNGPLSLGAGYLQANNGGSDNTNDWRGATGTACLLPTTRGRHASSCRVPNPSLQACLRV